MTRASFAPSLVDPLGQVDSRGAASIEAAIVEQSMSEASSAGRPRLQRWDCRCRDAFPGPPSARCSLLRSSCGDMDDHRLSLRHAWRRMGQDRWGADGQQSLLPPAPHNRGHAIRQSVRRRARSTGHCRGRAGLRGVRRLSPRVIGLRGWCCPSSAPWQQHLRRRQRQSSSACAHHEGGYFRRAVPHPWAR